MAKKYYWLKMKEDFFNDLAIKKLRKIAGGDTYTIIYLKMMLLSLKDEGILYYEGIEETFQEELALILDEDVENVKATVTLLLMTGLLEQRTATEAFLTRIPESIGSETRQAEIMRRKRAREKLEDGNTVTTMLPDVTKSYTEIDIDKEKEIDKRYKDILAYLNEKAGTAYKSSSKANQRHINARLAEGFTVEDFETVIDKKCAEWLGTDMEKYLRPETLFGSKFESYLNAPTNRKPEKNSHGFKERDYDFDELARRLSEL